MIITAFAQLRFAASLLSGRRFSVRGLRRTVADLRATIEEFGEPTEEARDLLTARAETDPDVIRHMAESRLKKAVRTAAARTPYYADLFARHGIDPRAVTLTSFSSLPRTPKSALRAAPFGFVSDRAEPVLMAQTTGTTGAPTCVWFSRYELEAITSFSALSLMLFNGIGPRHVIATLFSSRSTYTLVSMQQSGLLIGAGVIAIGMVDPRSALERLGTPLHIPGKAPRITHVSVTSSYLAALVQQAERDGWSSRDFGLEQIFAAGEILTDSLRHRAEEVFGAPVSETYSATEITPVGGQVCSHRHLHIPPEQGYVEILDPETGLPAEPGQVGTLVVTPYGLYRDTTLLIRYETGDLVRTLPTGERPECELRAIPATSRILGRAGTAAAHRARDILDVLEGERAVPLPARYALMETTCGARLYVVVSDPSPEVIGRLESGLFRRDAGIAEVIAVADEAELPVPCPVRADLREPSSAAARYEAADREPARSGA
jgi:phenylacetate-coenzyme A ligase PaaK-like adenylate-forming protein